MKRNSTPLTNKSNLKKIKKDDIIESLLDSNFVNNKI